MRTKKTETIKRYYAFLSDIVDTAIKAGGVDALKNLVFNHFSEKHHVGQMGRATIEPIALAAIKRGFCTDIDAAELLEAANARLRQLDKRTKRKAPDTDYLSDVPSEDMIAELKRRGYEIFQTIRRQL